MNVEITGLTRRFGRTMAVAGVDLQAGPGVFGLLGPNGVGKTSLLRMMATAVPPTSGRLRLLGRDPGSYGPRREIRRRLGYLPQNLGYYPGFTVVEFVEYFALLKEMPAARVEAAVAAAVERVELEGEAKAKLRTLSGGMLRRVGIAQAIVNEPELLLLDEPTAGLDLEQRVAFRGLLRDLGRRATVVVSTHLVEDVGAACAQVALMDEGKIVFHGTPADLAARGVGSAAATRGTGDTPRLRRAMAACSRRGRHRGRPAGCRNCRRPGRHRPDGRPRHDRHTGPARCGQRPADPLHSRLQPRRDPGLPEPRVCALPAGHSSTLEPVLSQINGLPGAPTRTNQAAATYQQGAGNSASVGLAGPTISGRPPVYHLLLPDQLLGPTMTTSELASQVRSSAGPDIVSTVIGDSPSASQAQHAVAAALMMAAGLRLQGSPPGTTPQANSMPVPSGDPRCEPSAASCAASSSARAAAVRSQLPPEVAPGSLAYAAARRFAALPASARHAWLVQHLTALRAGRITLAQLP